MTNENIYSSLQVVLDSNVSQLKTQSQEKNFWSSGTDIFKFSRCCWCL